MTSLDLTPPQSALLTAMREAIASGEYTNYFQATFLPDDSPTIVFFSRHCDDSACPVWSVKRCPSPRSSPIIAGASSCS